MNGKKLLLGAWLMLGTLALHGKTHAENDYDKVLFSTDKLAQVDIAIPDTSWQNLIGQARRKQYHVCCVIINGERLDSVAIRTKGASSLDDVSAMKSDRYSFTLKLNAYKKGQKYHGLSKFLLNNNIWDATQMKDLVVYEMAHFMGLPAPLTHYARVTVNGRLQGYYLMVEPVDKDFCMRNYPDLKSSIYRPYSNLSYKCDELSAYREFSGEAKVGGDSASLRRVVEALKSVDTSTDIEAHLDVDNLMKYMALQTMAVNYDCMTGHNTQNFYVYEGGGKVSLVPWDYNLAWGGYPDDDFGGGFGEGDFGGFGGFDPSQWGGWPGGEQHGQEGEHPHWDMPMGEWGGGFVLTTPGGDLGRSTPEEVAQIVNFPINTPFTEKLSKRKFFMNLLAVEAYKKRYYHYLNLLCRKYIQGGELKKTIKKVERQLGKEMCTEPNAFYTNEQFHTGVKMLTTMLQRKATSVLGQIAGTVPSTWDEQKAHPELLVPSDDINLRLTGGLGY